MSEPIIRTLHAHLGGDQNMLHASYALESRACASGYQANLVSPLDSFHSMGKHAGVIMPETRNTAGANLPNAEKPKNMPRTPMETSTPKKPTRPRQLGQARIFENLIENLPARVARKKL